MVPWILTNAGVHTMAKAMQPNESRSTVEEIGSVSSESGGVGDAVAVASIEQETAALPPEITTMARACVDPDEIKPEWKSALVLLQAKETPSGIGDKELEQAQAHIDRCPACRRDVAKRAELQRGKPRQSGLLRLRRDLGFR